MATPKDAKDMFDNLMPQALAKHPDKAREVDAIYFFDITGEGGGQWTVDLTADPPSVNAGDAGNAQCSITVSNEDFQTMLSDPQAGMQLFFQGKLQVTGDPMLATKLQQFLEVVTAG
ncbi:SCP2 sterol-binding domain-containing protein [Haliangium sp.]|uniref:SCP2 sterol-binding domain-containing protein n=1 Tax=Haliangium sp. TaxID=2663208 RepID=UPI003D0D2153